MYAALSAKPTTAPARPSHGGARPRARDDTALGAPAGLPLFLRMQTKLAVGGPADPQEQEADRVAEGKPAPGLRSAASGIGAADRSAEAGEVISSAGAGRPLDAGPRAEMEGRLGTGLGAVQVHTGAESATAAQAVGARAFTVGDHVVFGAGEYAPETTGGRRLIAHELAHVVQQGGGQGARIDRDVDPRATSITPAFARALSDDELEDQITLVRAYVGGLQPTAAEYAQARENRQILEDEKVTRLVRTGGPAMAGAGAQSTGEKADVAVRLAGFKQGVLLAAEDRLTSNQESLAQWRVLIDTQFSAPDLQTQVLAQSAADLEQEAEGSHSMRAFQAWAGESNPYMRRLDEDQARGLYHVCAGCHYAVDADNRAKEEAHLGVAWQTPAERLGADAGFFRQGTRLRDPTAMASGGSARIVERAIARIHPLLAPLGDAGYKVIPDDVWSTGAGASPLELKAAILANIDKRRVDYEVLKERIADGTVSYLELGPVFASLFPLADPDVQEAIRQEQVLKRIEDILSFGAMLVATLLSFLFPPLGLALAAVQIASGIGKIQQGYDYQLGTGANDVFSREQQAMAGELMASGAVDVTLGTVALAAGAMEPGEGATDPGEPPAGVPAEVPVPPKGETVWVQLNDGRIAEFQPAEVSGDPASGGTVATPWGEGTVVGHGEPPHSADVAQPEVTPAPAEAPPARAPTTRQPAGPRAFKVRKPRISGKEGAKDVPTFAKGERPYVGENGNDFARRVMDKRYGAGNWEGTGPGSEFSEIKKFARGFEDP